MIRIASVPKSTVPAWHAAFVKMLSAGRVSQLRQELYRAWCRFQGEAEPPEVAAVPA
jgi:hypothetical protein